MGPPLDVRSGLPYLLVRKISLVLGILAVGVGAWSLRHVRTSTLACTPHPGGTGGYGLTTGCLNQAWVEYSAFALILFGAVVASIALLLMRRGRDTRREAPNAGLRLLGTPGEDPAQRQQLAAGLTRLPVAEAEPETPGVPRLPKPGRRDTRQVS